MDSELGELNRSGDRWQLRFTRTLRHPAEKVWRALTESEHLAAWFPDDIEGEWEPGQPLQFRSRDMPEFSYAGRTLTYEPPKVLEFAWGDDDVLRFELEPHGDSTVLHFVNTFGEVGKAARDAGGWHACLDFLQLHLDGTAAPFTSGERWAEVHGAYLTAFPDEAGTIGPPEGHPQTST
jgi:uncharacterized protein YndB with AHSA1/START domain